MGVDSLVPIASLRRRVERREGVSGRQHDVFVGDRTEEESVQQLLTLARTRAEPLEGSARAPDVSWWSTSSISSHAANGQAENPAPSGRAGPEQIHRVTG
jgi:hypothetical protein